MTHLHETENGSNDTHKTSSSGGDVHGVGGTSLGSTRARTGGSAARVGANTGRLGDGALAGVLAADLAAGLERVEGRAVECAGGLEVESTIDLVESRERAAVCILAKCT